MSRIDDLIKENLSEDGTVLSLREKYIGLRGTMELFTRIEGHHGIVHQR
jgi:hypothetical protein